MAQSKGWQNLFDGKTLKGWMRLAGKAEYSVENGMIVGTTVENSGNTFWRHKNNMAISFLSLILK